jgi:signal transduction histidine kinase
MFTASRIVLILFVVAAVILAVAVPNLFIVARRAVVESREALADQCAAALGGTNLDNPRSRILAFEEVRSRYNVEWIGFAAAADPTSMPTLRRRVGTHDIAIVFRVDELRNMRTLVRVAGAAAVLGAVAGLMLLSVGVANAVGSGDNSSSKSSSNLIETFETSIRTLKGRESEMRRLRDVEKGRADELAAMTATLVRSISSGFIALDAEGIVVDMNQEARELLAVDPGTQVAGQSIASVAGSSSFARVLRGAVQDRETLQRMEVSEGSRDQVIGLTTVPLLDERGHCFGMLALFTDLTLMRKLERQVRDMQSLADLGEMSAGIAHEFRNSLSTVLGYLRLVGKTDVPQEGRERLRRAEEEAMQLATAVEGLLTFARPMRAEMAKVRLLDLVGDIAGRLAALSERAHVVVTGEEAVIEGDAALLGRALENVIRNAIEAVDEKGSEGDVGIEVADDPPRLTVRDTGIGLDATMKSRAFLPFQSSKPHGFGLGLALTRKIIVLHGGTIEIDGRTGEGTTVSIELPPAMHS